jgi:predicted MFS family arabinose efflux permease
VSTTEALLKNRDFLKLWTAQTVSYFGSMFGALGLTALVFLDATPGQMGVLAMAQGLPVLLFALLVGVYIDRLPRRPVLIVADVGRFAVLLSVPAAAAFDALDMGQLYAVAFAVGALELAFNLAYRSYLPALVTRDELLAANARLAATESVAETGSPAFGGFVVQAAGGPVAVLLDAVTFLFSGLFVAAIRKPEPPRPREQRSVAAEAREGISAVRQSSILRALTGAKGTTSFFGSFIGALYGVFLINELGLSPLAMGLTIGAGGLGSIFGSWLIGPLSRRIGFGLTVLISSGGFSACLIPLAGGPVELAFAIIVVAQLCGDPFWTMYEIGSVSLRQAVTSDEMLGRVSSTMHLVEAGLAPIGALTAGLLAEAIGVRETLAIAAAGVSAAALWVAFSPIPRLKEPPALDQAALRTKPG